MRNPSGYGSIKKLSGKRRRPYAVAITTEYSLQQKRRDISFLSEFISEELYAEVCAQYEKNCPRQLAAKQKQKIIGYYETRQEAMIALADYNKNPFDIDRHNITFKEVCDILKEEKFDKMGKASRGAYITSINKCSKLHNIRMKEIKKAHLQQVIDTYKEQSVVAQTKIITLFKAVYAFCLENDIVEKDYSAFVETTSEKEVEKKIPFSAAEVDIVRNNQEWIKPKSKGRSSRLDNVWLCDTILIMIYSGMRIGELLELKAADIHIDERWIDLRGTKTKAAKRIVPIHEEIVHCFVNRLEGREPDEHLFKANDGSKITVNAYEAQFFYPYCEAHKLAAHKPHECRHTFATFAAACHFDDFLLKRMIGHKMNDITKDVYTHTIIKNLVKEVNKLKI